jgi:hypothetical protein
MIEAELFHHRGMPATILRFDAINLRFALGNEWHQAKWEFLLGGAVTEIPTDQIEQISSNSVNFDLNVVDGSGRNLGQFTAEAIIVGFPSHSFCFVFSADEDGMWSGISLNKSFGRLVVVPHRLDPS